MKFYAVVSEYYDNGITKANSFIVHADKKPENTKEELEHCDRYTDYFDDPERAERWRQDALNG